MGKITFRKKIRMFSKIKKYIIGFFVLCGGVLFAFLSGRSAGRKDEKLKGLKKESKKVSDLMKNKKKTYKKKKVSNKEASDFLKNFSKEKK